MYIRYTLYRLLLQQKFAIVPITLKRNFLPSAEIGIIVRIDCNVNVFFFARITRKNNHSQVLKFNLYVKRKSLLLQRFNPVIVWKGKIAKNHLEDHIYSIQPGCSMHLCSQNKQAASQYLPKKWNTIWYLNFSITTTYIFRRLKWD